jgi:cell pole-organizing protein PopZ
MWRDWLEALLPPFTERSSFEEISKIVKALY